MKLSLVFALSLFTAFAEALAFDGPLPTTRAPTVGNSIERLAANLKITSAPPPEPVPLDPYAQLVKRDTSATAIFAPDNSIGGYNVPGACMSPLIPSEL